MIVTEIPTHATAKVEELQESHAAGRNGTVIVLRNHTPCKLSLHLCYLLNSFYSMLATGNSLKHYTTS